MKILHTSDWHLGKQLEGNLRYEEQEQFLIELCQICEEEKIDMLLIAGDVFDTFNPPAVAEKMFYSYIKKLSKNGERIIAMVSGNHDNPERLSASMPLAREHGIIIETKILNEIEIGSVGNFEITRSGKGFYEININEEKVVIGNLPYPSESRLGKDIFTELDEEKMQKEYSSKIGFIMDEISKGFKKECVNILISHLFTMGGSITDSERPIQIGGGFNVHSSEFPKDSDYIALGHLHRPQIIKGLEDKIRYSGSPIPYSRSEISYSKCVYVLDTENGKVIEIKEKTIKNPKPIEVWKADSFGDAIGMCEENQNRNAWAYLEVKLDTPLTQGQIKDIKKIKPDVLAIIPILNDMEEDKDDIVDNTKNIVELFADFFISENGTEPSKEVLDMFAKIAIKDGDN